MLLAVAGCQPHADGGDGFGAAPTTAATATATATPAAALPADPKATSSAVPAATGGTTKTNPQVTGFATAYGWAVPSPSVRVSHPTRPALPQLVEIHAADHPDDGPGYSRISFYFRGGFPSYEFGYAPQVEGEGSGDPIPLPGNGFVRIRFEQARAHDDAGRSTIVTSPPQRLGFVNLRGYGFGGDFEGYITYGLGLQVAPNSDQVLPLRVLELTRSDGFFIVAFDVRRG